MTDGLMTPELCGYTLDWASNKCHDVNQNGPCSFISFCTNGGKQHYHASHWTRKIIIQSQIPLLPHQRNPDRGIGLPSVERGAKFLQNERGYEYICRPRKARSHLEDLKDLGKNFSATIASVSQTIVYKMKRLIIRVGITNEGIPNEEIDNSENPINPRGSTEGCGIGKERKGSPKAYQGHPSFQYNMGRWYV